MRWWTRWLTRVVAADPGMRRLRSAGRVILSVVLALAVALPALMVLGQPLIAVAPAAVVAMISTLAVTESGTRAQVVTTLLMPVSAATSLTLAALTHGAAWLGEMVFLIVMFAAVYIQRFGQRATALGIVAFIAYFLALFLRITLSAVPATAGAAVVGALAALLVRLVLLRERPGRVWSSGVRALQARVRTLLHAMDDLVLRPAAPRHRQRVQDELLRLNATALALETDLDALTSLTEERADELRRHILDIELAAGNLVAALSGVLAEPAVTPEVRAALARVGAALRSAPQRAADTRARLGELATTLAELAEAIGARELHDAGEIVDRARQQEGDLVDLIEAMRAGPTSLRAVVHQMGRLGSELIDLARVLGGRVPEPAVG